MDLTLKNILNQIGSLPHVANLKGLHGSSKPLILAEFHRRQDAPLVIVSDSFETAEGLFRDMQYFLGSENLFFFPHWDVLPYDHFSPLRSLVGKRFHTLKQLLDGKCPVLVTTPHALMQRVMPVKTFRETILRVNAGDVIDPEFVKLRLQESGYTSVDVVEDQGDFSLHGHILDVFPLSETQPVRLEFSGTEAEHTSPPILLHIKTFDVQSQRSRDPAMESLTVLPGSEVLLNEESLSAAQRKLHRFGKEFRGTALRHFEKKLHSAERFPGIENLAPLFYPKMGTIFDYLPAEQMLVVDEKDSVLKRARHFYNEVFHEYEHCVQQKMLALPAEELFLSHLELGKIIEKGCALTVSTGMGSQETSAEHAIRLPFAGNLSLREGFRKEKAVSAVGHVVGLIREWQAKGTPVFLNAKNRTHADHCRQLLDDLLVETEVHEEKQAGEIAFLLEQGNMENGPEEIGAGPAPILVGPLSSGFRIIDKHGNVGFALLTEEEIFGGKTRSRRLQRARVQQSASSLDDLREGDAVVHLDYGIGRYSGLKKITAADTESEFMVLTYARDEKVYVPVGKFHLVQKYVNADGAQPKLNKLGEKTWKKTRNRVARAIEDIAEELAEIYAARKTRKGFRFGVDDHDMQEFELRFPFEETGDQLEAIQVVKEDMESDMPMDRLICGDVGFGKTEVAMRAAFKGASQGKQVAILVPTTILAQQHYVTFRERFEGSPFFIEVISRFRTTAEQRDIIKRLARGEIDILIGTHRMLSKDVRFKDLGLLVVDEEQRFGVRHKEKIRRFRAEVDVMTLTATPIPRTLYMSLMGIRDLSLINTPPADRLAVRTRLMQANDYVIQEAVSRELRRGGQVFVVHNRVETIYEYGSYLRHILPDARIAIGHGQLGEHQLEQVMLDFIAGDTDVLLSTTIIESGLDIPRANTILINNADQFGLAQLYQLRGRVGRSNVQAFAYLLVPPEKILNGVAQERLQVLQEMNDLGAGFKVASRDLEIRGAGNLLGSEQSGQIASVGLELYTRMVEKAVRKIRQQDEALLPLEEVQVRLDDIDQTIPESYIGSTNQRLSLYKAIGSIESDEALWDFRNGVEDRFGPMPESLVNLFMITQIRFWAQRYGVELIQHGKQRLRLQIRDSGKLQPDKLITWLSEPQTPLRYIPENTLDMQPVPPEMQMIQKSLKEVERVFS